MRKFGLIGYPLGHSFSKNYFTEKFLNAGLHDCSYENYPLKDINDFEKLITEEPYLCGINVTIPYKSDVIRFVDETDPEASEIGAVNVIKIKRRGNNISLYGFNSDITGIRDSLLPYIENDSMNAIVLGTGGSSRAVCHVLRKFGLKIIQVSRNQKPGIVTYPDLTSNDILNSRLIVNTTPLGMFPDIESKPDLNYSLLNKNHILFDLVYNPELTAFLKMGKEMRSTVISGLNMLHSQADKAWEIWNDDNL